MNTKDKSNISESIVQSRFLERGFTVLQPFGDNERYDLVVEHEGDFTRVQVKTAFYSDRGAYRFKCRSVYMNSQGSHSEGYSEEDVDIFAVYIPQEDEVVLFDLDELPKTSMHLRPAEHESHNPSKVNWVEDHTIDKKEELVTG